MTTEIRMPQLGVSMESGTIFKWFKKVGDQVKAGDIVATIETEKLTEDIISTTDGFMLKIVAPVGYDVPVQGVMAIVGEAGESIEDESSIADASVNDVRENVVETEMRRLSVTDKSCRRVIATPLARKVAAKLGINLEKIKPSGTSGRIKEKDVRAYTQKSVIEEVATEEMSTEQTVKYGIRGTRVEKMSNMRKAISTGMKASLEINAQTHSRMRMDMTEAVKLREQYKKMDIKISYNDIIIRCAAKALSEMPVINCSVDGTNIVYHDYVNVGMAVSLDNGLIVPVIKNADIIGLTGISEAAKTLVEKARDKVLSYEEYHDGTFTVSSLGMFEVESFAAIINPPESAILAVGMIEKQQIITDDDIAIIRPICYMTLTYDHRVIDGAEAAKFLQLIKRYLQHPLLML